MATALAMGHEFQLIDPAFIEELFSLEREKAIYTDLWIEDLEDFRHVKIAFTTEEIKDYVRRLWAYELFLQAGCPDRATEVVGIDADIAAEADSYPEHYPAAFLGEVLESLVCGGMLDRYLVIEEQGKQSLLSTLRRTVDSLTPIIRSFQSREKGLQPWVVECEDDVRDLLYAILRPAISDIHREEPMPSVAGTFKVVDLCSSLARTLIEVKWIDKKGRWRSVIKQIQEDIQGYIVHPDAQTLVFIVVDAAKDIPDPAQFESDLSGRQQIKGKDVEVIVYVREP